jgi:hypothetical protein
MIILHSWSRDCFSFVFFWTEFVLLLLVVVVSYRRVQSMSYMYEIRIILPVLVLYLFHPRQKKYCPMGGCHLVLVFHHDLDELGRERGGGGESFGRS